jgi:hypothetical protein
MYIFFNPWGQGGGAGSTSYAGHYGLLYQPWMINECGALIGMKIGKGNRDALRKSTPVPLSPLQIPQYLTRNPGRLDAKPASNALSYGMANL